MNCNAEVSIFLKFFSKIINSCFFHLLFFISFPIPSTTPPMVGPALVQQTSVSSQGLGQADPDNFHFVSAISSSLLDSLHPWCCMPASENQTKVKQFLGLVGYYHKFVPCFSDISRPLAKLTRKDTAFVWTKECHLAFNMLKEKLPYSFTLIAVNPTHCSQMLASMDGLAFSLRSLKLKSK